MDDGARARIERLKAVRRQLGWSEEFCAHELGVTFSTLNRWERGASAPRSRAVLSAIDRFIAQHDHPDAGHSADHQPTGGDHASS